MPKPEMRLHLRLRSVRRGGYLLSHFRSIIDVVRFNFSVRNGKRWSPHAMATLVSSSGFNLTCKVRKRRWKRSEAT